MIKPKIDVVHSLKGRIRLKLSMPLVNPKKICNHLIEKKIAKYAQYNSLTKSFLIEYSENKIDSESVIYCFCAEYALDVNAQAMTLNFIKGGSYSFGYSAYLSLTLIIADLAISSLTLTATPPLYQKALRWFAIGSTVGAIFEHGYRELSDKGAFDPEVMSIMYLINQMGKENNKFSPAIAWILTFGRHIVENRHDSVELAIINCNNKIKVIPETNQTGFANKFFNKCIESYQKTTIKI